MAEQKNGCVKSVKGPITAEYSSEGTTKDMSVKEGGRMRALVGNEAPDFEANAFIAGEGFKTVKLSDYKGKWIVVCFYPGDFTFV